MKNISKKINKTKNNSINCIEDFCQEKQRTVTINVQANNINEIRDVDLEKNSIRILKNKKILSSNFLGVISQNDLRDTALSNSVATIPFSHALEQYEISNKKNEASLPTSFYFGETLSVNDIVSNVEKILSHFKYELPGFLFSGKYTYSENIKNSFYSLCQVASKTHIKAMQIQQVVNKSDGFLILNQKGSSDIMDSVLEILSTSKTIDLKKYDQFIELHRKFNDNATITAGTYPVLFLEAQFLSKFKESIMPEKYHNNACLFANKLGEVIFNNNVSIVDRRFDEENALFNLYDDEANRLEPIHYLVRNGVFESIIYDREKAHKYKTKTTGNGRRSFKSAISTMPYKVDFIPTSNLSIKSMLSQHEKVVLAIMCGGGDTTNDGNFSTPVQVSFLVENGVVKGKLPQITVTNNIKNMLGKDFIGVPKDKIFFAAGYPLLCNMNVVLN